MKRSKSQDRLRLRASLPRERQETLLPCPACAGNKLLLKETPGGLYTMKTCRWCDGTGAVDRTIQRMWARWIKMLAHNRNKGHCG